MATRTFIRRCQPELAPNLLKGMSHDELLDAVRKVHAGRQYLPKTVQQSLANRMPSSDLSAREAEILGLIVKGLTNKEIAAKLNITVGAVSGT